MEFFDILPDIAFLRIYDYLPLTDRFRASRVSQSFLRISQLVNARIKSLNLYDSMFDKLDVDQFEVILCLCQHNIRDITFGTSEMAVKFSEYVCPQLVDLNLDYASITNEMFARIITNHPNLQSLKWWSMVDRNNDEDGDDIVPPSYHVQFPPVNLPHLETLHMQLFSGHMDDITTLESLIDRCPNLKELKMTLDRASSEDVWDRFFRSVPRLESLRMDLYGCQVHMENLEWFWRLPLKSLTIDYQRPIDAEFMINDEFVNKLVENFTNIEQLDMSLFLASDEAIVALTRLEKLRVVNTSVFCDEAIHNFSSCQHLERLDVDSSAISVQTFLELFRNCPKLKRMTTCGVYYGNHGLLNAEAVSLLLSVLANLSHRPSVNFHFRPLTYEDGAALYSAWHSVQVQTVVDGLKQNHGIEVNICVEHNPEMDEIYDEMELENGEEEAMDIDGEDQPAA